MGGAKKLQTEVDEAVLSTADAAQALREITALLCKRTRSPVALLARWEDEERGASPLAHPGLSVLLAAKLCAALPLPCGVADPPGGGAHGAGVGVSRAS